MAEQIPLSGLDLAPNSSGELVSHPKEGILGDSLMWQRVLEGGYQESRIVWDVLAHQPDLQKSAQDVRDKWASIKKNLASSLLSNSNRIHAVDKMVIILVQIFMEFKGLEEDLKSGETDAQKRDILYNRIASLQKTIESIKDLSKDLELSGGTVLLSNLKDDVSQVLADNIPGFKLLDSHWKTKLELDKKIFELQRALLNHWDEYYNFMGDIVEQNTRLALAKLEIEALENRKKEVADNIAYVKQQMEIVQTQSAVERERLKKEAAERKKLLDDEGKQRREEIMRRKQELSQQQNAVHSQLNDLIAKLQSDLESIK